MFAEEATHDEITEAKEIYIQLLFGRFRGKLVLRFKSPSVYICIPFPESLDPPLLRLTNFLAPHIFFCSLLVAYIYYCQFIRFAIVKIYALLMFQRYIHICFLSLSRLCFLLLVEVVQLVVTVAVVTVVVAKMVVASRFDGHSFDCHKGVHVLKIHLYCDHCLKLT